MRSIRKDIPTVLPKKRLRRTSNPRSGLAHRRATPVVVKATSWRRSPLEKLTHAVNDGRCVGQTNSATGSHRGSRARFTKNCETRKRRDTSSKFGITPFLFLHPNDPFRHFRLPFVRRNPSDFHIQGNPDSLKRTILDKICFHAILIPLVPIRSRSVKR